MHVPSRRTAPRLPHMHSRPAGADRVRAPLEQPLACAACLAMGGCMHPAGWLVLWPAGLAGRLALLLTTHPVLVQLQHQLPLDGEGVGKVGGGVLLVSLDCRGVGRMTGWGRDQEYEVMSWRGVRNRGRGEGWPAEVASSWCEGHGRTGGVTARRGAALRRSISRLGKEQQYEGSRRRPGREACI